MNGAAHSSPELGSRLQACRGEFYGHSGHERDARDISTSRGGGRPKHLSTCHRFCQVTLRLEGRSVSGDQFRAASGPGSFRARAAFLTFRSCHPETIAVARCTTARRLAQLECKRPGPFGHGAISANRFEPGRIGHVTTPSRIGVRPGTGQPASGTTRGIDQDRSQCQIRAATARSTQGASPRVGPRRVVANRSIGHVYGTTYLIYSDNKMRTDITDARPDRISA